MIPIKDNYHLPVCKQLSCVLYKNVTNKLYITVMSSEKGMK